MKGWGLPGDRYKDDPRIGGDIVAVKGWDFFIIVSMPAF